MSIINKINKLYRKFDGEKGVYGFSENNNPLYYFKIAKSPKPVIIVQYSIHAREFITAHLAIKQLEDFYKSGKEGSVYFLPLANPDGVKIALSKNKLYKANSRGVDLNLNFGAKWGTGASNKRVKGEENYIGEHPFSEKETRALRDFTFKINPDITVSYHAKGEEIYYEFFQDKKTKKRDYKIAKKLAKTTSYAIKSTPNSAGGYKDWCVEKLKIPSFTIEVGSDKLSHPIKANHLKQIYEKNKNVIKILTKVKPKHYAKIYENRTKRGKKSL